MSKPLVVVNFKTYSSASGEAAEHLFQAMERFGDGPATLVAAVSAFDLNALSAASSSVGVWSQHLGPGGTRRLHWMARTTNRTFSGRT